MTFLSRGQNIRLADLSSVLQLRVALRFRAPGLKFDFSCFGLDDNGKLSDERYFIFYNQKQSPENALRLEHLSATEATFALDLARLPTAVSRLVFVASVDGAGIMGGIESAVLFLGASDGMRAQFALQSRDLTSEAVMVAEMYRQGEWRIAAKGQALVGGLGTVLKHFRGRHAVAPAPERKTPATVAPRSVAPRAAVKPASANVCARCGQQVASFQNPNAPGQGARRCSQCDGEVKRVLGVFRRAFLHLTVGGTLSADATQALRAILDRERVPWEEGLAFVRGDALQLLERNLAMAAANGIIEPHQESEFNSLQVELAIAPDLVASLQKRMLFLKEITRIRQGHLPKVSTNTHLNSEEVCHLEVAAAFHKIGARAVTLVQGRLLVTNRKIHFLSHAGGWTMQYKNVMRVECVTNHLYIELATRQGNGRYDVAQAERAEAIIDTATRLNKRQLMLSHEGRDTRSVPRHVQIAVWQRDAGKCVQCGASSYLEYDHIIPRSKGGATSESNLQLLCRCCNSEKGDRI